MVKRNFKYFIGYKDAKKIWTLCIFLPKISAYRKNFDETKFVPSFIKDDELLKNNNNKTWKKVKNTIDKEFDSDPVYKKISKNLVFK